MKRLYGFTLIELIVVMVIVSIISVYASRFLVAGLNAYLGQKNMTDANWQPQLALEVMMRDIQGLRSSANLSTMTTTQLSFTDINGTSITYSLSSNQLLKNSIALANAIQSLSFTYYDRNGNVTTLPASVRYINIALTSTYFNVSTLINLRTLS